MFAVTIVLPLYKEWGRYYGTNCKKCGKGIDN